MQIRVNNKDFSLYINHAEIEHSLQRIAGAVNEQYRDKNLLVIGVLNGAFMFTSDLVKKIRVNCEVSFMRVSSYAGTQSSGHIENLIGLKEDVSNRHIIIVEDIIDTGLTMQHILKQLEQKKPASVKVATLLFKKEALQTEIVPDFVGFEIPSKFVVGYGLDFNGAGRNLPDIYAETE